MGPVRNATNGTTNETYGYDNGGRITNIVRGGVTLKLGYNTADQLTAVTNGANWTNYVFDAAGRRVRASDQSGAQRRFLVAPAPDTDLECVHLVADSGNNLKAGYVFVGDDPLIRFDAGGSNSRVYYLEDAMGSVIGLVSNGVGIATFSYDGFGKLRRVTGSGTNAPSGAGGDFRFHGAWLETVTDLYHMRARDYDQRTGRFLSRDPDDGSTKVPETLNPYVFARNNPLIYSDPSGEFSLLDIDLTAAINFTLQTIRTAAINYARNKARSYIGGVLGQQISDFLGAYLPDELNPDRLKHIKGGTALEQLGRGFFCELFGNSYVHFEVGVQEKDGKPVDNGLDCSERNRLPEIRPGVRRPDLIFGYDDPISADGKPRKMWIIGEVKIRRSTLYQYTRDPGQLDAILRYARNHTYVRTAVFITFTGGKKKHADDARMFIRNRAIKRGAFAIIVSPGYIGF
jgi:RHS repeat-associated protein